MSPVGAIFMPFPPKAGKNMLHPLPRPIVELVTGVLESCSHDGNFDHPNFWREMHAEVLESCSHDANFDSSCPLMVGYTTK